MVAEARKIGAEVRVELKSATFPNFLMVFVEGGNTPTVKHDTLPSALKEARRLCKATGRRSVVLTSTFAFEPKDPELLVASVTEQVQKPAKKEDVY